MKINEIKNQDFYKLSKTKDMKNNPIFKNNIDYHYIEYILVQLLDMFPQSHYKTADYFIIFSHTFLLKNINDSRIQ